MIKSYFCIFLKENGQIQKVYSTNISKNTSDTLLFSFPIVSFVGKSIALDDLEKIFFYLGNFLAAHLSLKQSFENLEIPSLSRKGEKYVKELCRHVESGHSLSNFFKKNDLISDQVIVSTLVIAEKTGHWDLIFTGLSEYIQKIHQMRSKIQEILFYPIIVMGVLILFIIFILPPIITELIHFMPNNEIPLIATILLNFKDFWFISIPFLSAPLFLLAHFKNLILRKILGIDLELEHLFYLLSFLLKQKITFVDSLNILSREERFASIKLEKIYKSVQEGKNIAVVFEEQKRFPKFIISFLKLSQETSHILENTEKIHSILTQIHEKIIKKTMNNLPSILILSIGVIFVLIITGIFLPIYDRSIQLVEGG